MAPFGHHLVRILIFSLLVILFFSIKLQAQTASFGKNDFAKADSVAELYPNHSLKNLKSLSDKLTTLSTDIEKFRAIYKWVCDNIENDYGFYVKNKYKRHKFRNKPVELKQWNKKNNPRVFQKLLNDHTTICTGYAYLLKELSYHAGIKCVIVDGYGRTAQANIGGAGIANHSWNAVQLNSKWYVCDATWSSGTNDPQQAKFIKKYNDAYFLATPSLFVRNHYPLDTTWILLREKPTLQEFLNGPLIYRDAFSHKILPVFPETFDVSVEKGDKLTFLMSNQNKKVPEKFELQITQGSKSNSFYPTVYQQEAGLYAVDHAFTRKGSYVVHLLQNNDHLFTYTITVSKY